LGRQEKKWFDPSLQIIAYVRQLDPAKGKAGHQTLERNRSVGIGSSQPAAGNNEGA
jgi:hypothetical protein